jgi:hypothetical protein
MARILVHRLHDIHGPPLTFDRVRIVALRKEGIGATEIARAVGCKWCNVYKELNAAGLK